MQILVTGATGFIGAPLCAALAARGDTVRALTRDPDRAAKRLADGVHAVALPEDAAAWDAALVGCDAVVNLMGHSVVARWTTAGKERIRSSRVDNTTQLAAAITRREDRPSVLISGSALGYYGFGDQPVDETAPPGEDFLATVCREWEAAAAPAAEAGVRVVLLRTGIVLETDGGPLERMLTPFKAFVGGPVAGGKQWMSWIHRADLVRMILWALDTESVSGPLNGTAPDARTNRDFSRALAAALHRPCIFPVPGFMLHLMMGSGAEIVTRGQRVVPAVAQAAGFQFRFGELEPALADILS